ncbi:MAG: TonB-dependent receptor, partial [Alphaproteobacteria bacterium]
PALFRPDGYAVFDAYASYDLTETVRLTAAVLNVTNERYFEWPLPNAFENSVSDAVARSNPLELQTQPGRTFRVGIDVLF